MRPDRMTTKSQEAFRDALDLASRRGAPELLPEHLVRAMLEQDGGVALPLFQKAGGDPAALEKRLDEKIESLPRVSGGAEPSFARRTMEMLPKADDAGKELTADPVTVEHLLAAIATNDREL